VDPDVDKALDDRVVLDVLTFGLEKEVEGDVNAVGEEELEAELKERDTFRGL
jgi:hypothetical protein